jgi:nitrile hydratase beta subunit
MNGPHDLGGQMGFGPIAPEWDEPIFHAAWEKRALGLTLCCGALGHWNLDESRHARERLRPADHYASSYYEIWVKALETLLIRHGFVSAAELAEGCAINPAPVPRRRLLAPDVRAMLAKGGPCDRPVGTARRFSPGDKVRTINAHVSGHTRLPRYARGKNGRVEAVRGGFVLPDTNAHGAGENPQIVYTVVFTALELWGAQADPSLEVSIDAWESYLEPV